MRLIYDFDHFEVEPLWAQTKIRAFFFLKLKTSLFLSGQLDAKNQIRTNGGKYENFSSRTDETVHKRTLES